MKTVRLDFPTTAGYRQWLLGTAPRAPLLAVACLFAAAAAAGVIAWEALQVAKLGDALRAVSAAHFSSRAEIPRKPSIKVPVEQIRAWNELARQLNTPWPAVFDTLESLTPDSVALVLIEPDASRGAIRLQGEARSLEELLQYAATLRGMGPFVGVSLVKHEPSEGAGATTTRLTFEASLGADNARRARQPGESR